MKGSKRPVFSNAKGGKSGTFGKNALAQAKGLRATQKSSVGTNADDQRSTQDKAWEGSTPEGAVTGGSGVAAKPGVGAGVVTSPSLDNTGGGGGNGHGEEVDDGIPDNPSNTDVSPWKGLPQKAMAY
ncbi:MAG: hypothetical protein WCK75_11750, partial [Elusimicrobiota bacterium]